MIESSNTLATASFSEEIDFRELFCMLWSGKWLIAGITFSAALISILTALLIPDVYRSEALLAPVNQGGAGRVSALTAQYGGLASLAGINIGGGAVDKTALGIEVLKSRKFISDFVDRRDILVPLMAAQGWDRKTGKLLIDPDIYNVESGKWLKASQRGGQSGPTSQEAFRVFSRQLSVARDNKNGFVTISIEHYSPLVAKEWVDWLVVDLNSSVMRHDVVEAEQAIEYLHEQIAATSLADLQNVFFSLVEEQTKTVMLARVSPEYLFRTIDPAVVPENRAKPKRKLIVVLGTLFGGMLGVLFVLVRRSIDRSGT